LIILPSGEILVAQKKGDSFMNKYSKLFIVLALIAISCQPVQAESKKYKVLKGVYNVAKDFIASGSGVYFQGGYLPGNGYGSLNNYTNQLNGTDILPYLNSSSNLYTGSVNGYGQYYPISGNQPVYQNNVLTSAQPFEIVPSQSNFNPTGEIFLANAHKTDVLILIKEFCSQKGWSLNKPGRYYGEDEYSMLPDAYKISFTRFNDYTTNHRHIVVNITQKPNGTSITAFSSAYLVREEIGDLIGFFNNYYNTRVSHFR
jgi:hypothetical protein